MCCDRGLTAERERERERERLCATALACALEEEKNEEASEATAGNNKKLLPKVHVKGIALTEAAQNYTDADWR